MFIYLSKKIAIPNNVRLKSLSWNGEQGWIACGGENGMLKVLKLDSGKPSEKKGLAAPSNLSMNQTLEGHNGSVNCVTWNESYRKLTTSDQYGLIIVWMLHKGMWFEEMINNRNESTVRDMKWAHDGQRICIAYQDGHVIVGSVDGNRLWGKELRIELCFLEWSPDGRNLIFATLDHKVHIYDSAGNYIAKMNLASEDRVPVIGLEWFDTSGGVVEQGQPSLAIGFSNGLLQLMRSESDDQPVVVDTEMSAAKVSWNTSGTVVAVAGNHVSTSTAGERREVAMMKFYSPQGEFLRTLKVPGSTVAALSFEGSSLRIALAVDSFIYFANIRPEYKWGYFGSTVVCAYPKFERSDTAVLFWNCTSGERVTKYVKRLMDISACGDNCALVTQSAETNAPYYVILCNALGSPVDSKYVDIEPKMSTLTKHHFVCASSDQVYVWQYRTLTAKLTSVSAPGSTLRRKEGREQAFHVDDLASGVSAPPEASLSGLDRDLARMPTQRRSNDPIIALCASDRAVFIARESGALLKCSLPHVALEQRYQLRARPHRMEVNCDATRLAYIDANGVLGMYSLERNAETGDWGEQLPFERKDAWDFKWSSDNPELFAMMEKTRMYIFRGLEAEEPVLSSAYLCAFADLEITAVLLDELVTDPEAAGKDLVLRFDTKSLRDTRELLDKVSLHEAYAFVEDRPHPRLWRLLADAALRARDFTVAEKAFVHCADYLAIHAVKRFKLLGDPKLQEAEVHAFYGRFEEAEKIYVAMDRRDLALDLRARLGDWFRVVQLVQQGGGGDDTLLTTAYDSIGDYYAERQRPAKAAQHYAQSKNARGLVSCYYALEDYVGLEKLIHALPESSPLLQEIGNKFVTVGLADQATAAFTKAGDVQSAVKACVDLNQWTTAVALAEQHQLPEIEKIIAQYAKHLLAEKKIMTAVELYHKAGQATDAARLLTGLAKESGDSRAPPLRIKKLYVLAALQVDTFRRKTLDTMVTAGTHNTAQTLAGLMRDDATTGSDKALDSAWRGAEAYHFLCLAQRQLYEGHVDMAVRTALRLKEYEGMLDAKEIYSLVALTAFYAKFYGQCSRALIKLESLDVSPEQHEAYDQLAVSIFTRFRPEDPSVRNYKCSSCAGVVHDWTATCGDCGTHFPPCIVTGRALVNAEDIWVCRTCKHKAHNEEIKGFSFCPLCHASTSGGGAGGAQRGVPRSRDV
mmetsp:Transcript_25550/g.75022  ORF Transcript_25550/g.75022 Transcript_25550/m.75022 type:complete len:1200 (-) Transcript_25550:181-3780(-)